MNLSADLYDITPAFLNRLFCFILITKQCFLSHQNQSLQWFLPNLIAIIISMLLPTSTSLCQFHQHFTRGFFVWKFWAKLFCTYIKGLNFCWCKNIGANTIIKCWWNWPDVDPNNFKTCYISSIFWSLFYHYRSGCRDDYFGVNFDHFYNKRGRWGSSKKWLMLKIK
jgi:hypothetical protein